MGITEEKHRFGVLDAVRGGSALTRPRARAARLRRTLVALGTALAVAYSAAIRPWMLTWGSTEEERARPLPGDDLVPTPTHITTRAITIHASPREIWSWLVQMGQDRAGFYTHNWVEGSKALQWLLFLPTLLFRFLYGMRGLHVLKKYGGTVGTAAVGMFEEGDGWAIPIGHPQSLMMTVGGIGVKPGIVDGSIAIRDYLSLTISLDHEIIDGAPAARFSRRLKELIEAGHGFIEQEEVLSEPLPVPDSSR